MIGQKGTFVPSSCETAIAKAVLPVPGPPASRTARPDIFFDLIRSTTTPHACRPQKASSAIFSSQDLSWASMDELL